MRWSLAAKISGRALQKLRMLACFSQSVEEPADDACHGDRRAARLPDALKYAQLLQRAATDATRERPRDAHAAVREGGVEGAMKDLRESIDAYVPGAENIDGGGFEVQPSSGDPNYLYVQFESLKHGYVDGSFVGHCSALHESDRC